MRRSKVEATNTNEVEAFVLQLPTDINVEPKFKVPLSKKHIALIYETTESSIDRNGHEGDPHPAFTVMVVHAKNGALVDRYHSQGMTFRRMHTVKQYLIDQSATLNVKKRTRRTVETDEETDDE